MSDQKQEKTFRDKISTVSLEGSRVWIHCKQPKGTLYKYRSVFAYLLLIFLVLAPILKVNGEQMILLDVLGRRFILFGIIFWPQDFYLFYLMMLSVIVFIILFTVVYGRLFCGWACPQTVFLEFVFRKIEWLIDGTPAKQKKLAAQGWTFEKIWKRTIKHGVFWGLSFFFSNVFLSYLIGFEELIKIASEPISEHLTGFIAISIFSSAYYFIYAWFREQVCTIMCPYGRLQGVLLDKNSVIVAYDQYRGEPRGVARKKEKEEGITKGDCIDCKQCVEVCPTGIDIRNGNQLECINCTACIDACNKVMTKIGKPKGLIRFDSETGIKTGKKFQLSTRNVAYSIVLVLILIFASFLFFTRPIVETTILRTPGMTYQEQENNELSNVYNFKIVNKSHEQVPISIKLIEPEYGRIVVAGNILLEYNSKTEGVIVVFFNKDQIKQKRTKLRFGIFKGKELLEDYVSTFTGPDIK
ncbi:MAG: cytochrome c oxidase accessory protein CcoG [Bacteroidota bacterium]